jgi:hypothetical protein
MEKKKDVKKKDASKKYEKPVLVRFDVPPATGLYVDGSAAVSIISRKKA